MESAEFFAGACQKSWMNSHKAISVSTSAFLGEVMDESGGLSFATRWSFHLSYVAIHFQLSQTQVCRLSYRIRYDTNNLEFSFSFSFSNLRGLSPGYGVWYQPSPSLLICLCDICLFKRPGSLHVPGWKCFCWQAHMKQFHMVTALKLSYHTNLVWVSESLRPLLLILQPRSLESRRSDFECAFPVKHSEVQWCKGSGATAEQPHVVVVNCK